MLPVFFNMEKVSGVMQKNSKTAAVRKKTGTYMRVPQAEAGFEPLWKGRNDFTYSSPIYRVVSTESEKKAGTDFSRSGRYRAFHIHVFSFIQDIKNKKYCRKKQKSGLVQRLRTERYSPPFSRATTRSTSTWRICLTSASSTVKRQPAHSKTSPASGTCPASRHR